MSSTETKVKSVLVIEVLGRPPELITETLNDIVKKISGENGVKVISSKLNPPALIKDQKDFYTSFAEIEIETDNVLYLAILMFKYMPAYVEIISPQNLSLQNSDLNDVFNELTRRLHGYDEIVRILENEKMILENRLRGSFQIKENIIPKEEKKKEEKIEKKDKKKKK